MQTKRQLRRENKQLREARAVDRQMAIAARGDEAIANGEADLWKRRAIENADRLIAASREIRELRRLNAALERAARRGHGKVLEAAS